MKSKLLDITIIIICFSILFILLIDKNIVYSSVIYSLNMWVNNLIPAMFPFFIISDLLINYNITNYIPDVFKKIFMKIFNITDNMFSILLLSMISGFPSNARNTRTLYDKKIIDSEEANHILMFTHFANPVFVLTTVGYFFLHNEKVGIIILISHYLSNFFVGLICRNCFSHDNKKINCSYIKNKNILINSINRSVDMILLICGIVTTFMLLSTIIVDILGLNIYVSSIIKGIFEITIGVESISKLNIPLIYKTLISSSFLSFGGISIHMQVVSQIAITDIKYRYFFIGRILQTVISLIISYLLFIIYL